MVVVLRNKDKRIVIASGLEQWEAEDMAEYYEYSMLEGNWHAELEEE